MNVIEALQAARLAVLKQYPYLAPLVHKLTLIEEPGVPTIAINEQLRVYYNPEFIKFLIPTGQDIKVIHHILAGIMLHETMHILLRHAKRNKVIHGIAPLDNIAMDLEINGVIITDNIFKLPEQGCFPGKGQFADMPSGLTFEQYYKLIMDKVEKQGNNGPSTTGVAGGDCGSGATGRKGTGEPDSGNGEGEGDIGTDNAGGASDIQVEMAINAVAENIGKFAGNVHGTLSRFAGDRLRKPTVSWQTILRRIIVANMERVRGFDEVGYHRLSARGFGLWESGNKVCLPSRYDTKLNIAVGIDTSDSMGQAQLQSALSETNSICRASGASLKVFCIDTEVSGKIQEIDIGSKISLSGGGGTDMGVACTFAQSHMNPKPDILIILTDCYTPWPTSPPKGIRVIVCAIGNDNPTGVPKWADLVIAKDREG
mgnify:FL=1